ncbi:MAG TPA: gluconokinase [Geminicoccaceae bacterium]
MVVVIMGVSGSGKTTVGLRLAEMLGASFAEGDDFHPAANIEKMRAGIPLDDSDRAPWLEVLSRQIGAWLDAGERVVLACSALKQSYRTILRGGRSGVHFVHLRGDEGLIRGRLELRRGHYMPPTLLASQIQTLEEPDDAIVVDITGEPEAIARTVAAALRGRIGLPPSQPA